MGVFPMWVVTMFDGDNNKHVAWLQHAVYSQALWTIVKPCQDYMAFACRLLGDSREEEMGVNIEKFDHRTLQNCAHDILAAVWRFKFRANLLQLELPFDRVIPPLHGRISDWPWEEEAKAAGDIYARELDFGGLTEMSERMLKHQAATRGIYEPITAKGNVPLTAIDLDHMRHWLDWLNEEVQSWKHDLYLVRYVMKILTNQNQPEGYKAESELAWALVSRFGDVPWPKGWARAIEKDAYATDS